MRIAVVHQHRRSAFPSGEDAVFREEVAMLRRHGHAVETFERFSDDLVSVGDKIGAALGVSWNPWAARAFMRQMRAFSPQVVHFHNIVPSISPATVAAAAELGSAVVMTLHSFWLFCANGTLMREGRVCEDCLGRVPLPALRHGCYRNSRAATLPLFATQTSQRLLGTLRRQVHRFIAPTQVVRDKAVAGGLDGARIVVKPHMVPDAPDELRARPWSQRRGALFVGRLGEEKGVRPLLDAWARLEMGEAQLTLVGDGPLMQWCRQHPATRKGRVRLLGLQPPARCRELMAEAQLLVFPSICYETFGLSIAEAMSAGTPVLATRGGAAEDHIVEGQNGWLIEPGAAGAIERAAVRALGDAAALEQMGRQARQTYVERFGEQQGHDRLINVYEEAMR